MKSLSYIKNKISSRRARTHQYFSFDVPGEISIKINVKPYIDITIEIPRNENETDVYCLDLTHISPNTLFNKLNTQAYYVHTRTRKAHKQTGDQNE